MSYVTTEQLEDRYGTRALIDLTDRDSPATGAIDADTVARAIADADAMIDGYLATRYSLPVAEVPPILVPLAGAIVFYQLHTYSPDDKTKADYEQALKTLAKISDGMIKLPLATAGEEAAQTDAGGVRVNDRDRPFTEDTMKGLI